MKLTVYPLVRYTPFPGKGMPDWRRCHFQRLVLEGLSDRDIFKQIPERSKQARRIALWKKSTGQREQEMQRHILGDLFLGLLYCKTNFCSCSKGRLIGEITFSIFYLNPKVEVELVVVVPFFQT